ncbi:methyltransferase [Actinophytocola sp. NPDC049390]|uniref:methyltransferase n=1 Tax=Actinophytocola sp. NPDC049390 TaxID=3363894 RepID=UPI0037AD2A35
MADKELRTHHTTTSSPAQPVDAPSIVSAYDWGALGHVVDVGGGDGSLLIALLNEYPALRGTVVDLPAAAETARKMLFAAGLSDRANAVAADPLDAVPDGAEGYLLSAVLCDRNDDDANTILRNCATAAGEDGAVFVIEPVPPVDGVVVDTGPLGVTGTALPEPPGSARQARGLTELTALAERAGLQVTAVHTAGTAAIVELAAR